ncbi:RNA polymerase II transcription factor B subunit 4 [Reticulomyxa filosa]|uniref:RNA polymerase II transcription factor B subunit 4 n=1 Tax=Reticulomyxa filosa TaxID=46433 RepID=X6NSA6_RETFI|nr:RNA polymerase II transcription factor B subunit 4 [Reticulomyxa filosa]|eukprot:ETO28619.1 RNA polymerase II transcription factor B subunit 4 [Reticulomyxa filosa]
MCKKKKNVVIDACVLCKEESTFLEQATLLCDGIYSRPLIFGGLLQHLLMTYLSPPSVRKHLALPLQKKIDLRASCFCHHTILDMGFVCPVCLSSSQSPTLFYLIFLSCSTYSVTCANNNIFQKTICKRIGNFPLPLKNKSIILFFKRHFRIYIQLQASSSKKVTITVVLTYNKVIGNHFAFTI